MSLLESITEIRQRFSQELEHIGKQEAEIVELKNRYLGRKGLVTDLFSQMKSAPPNEKPVLGKALNQLKLDLTANVEKLIAESDQQKQEQAKSAFDFTLP